MTTLADTQAWLQSVLLDASQCEREAVERQLLPSPRQGASERLAIYQRSYAARLLRCMAEQFPALQHALGPALFEAFARSYLAACPSRSYTLHRLGERFPAYLDATRPDRELPEYAREDWIDFMVDLARFELALFSMLDAPGHEGRPYAELDTPDAELRVQACVALVEARHAVGEYHHEVRLARAPSFTAARRCWYVLVRRDFLLRTLPLQAGEHLLLADLRAGHALADALARLAAASGRELALVEQAWQTVTRPRLIRAGVLVPASTLSSG